MIPEWIKHLKNGDEILCVFGFSGRAVYVTIVEPVNMPYHMGYWVRYSDEKDIHGIWILEFDKYSTAVERDHWIAYEVNKDESHNSRDPVI